MKARRRVPDDINEVLRLVQTGKLFALQDWIKVGKRLRNSTGDRSDSSVLRAAVETGFHSMVEELLRAGGWSPKDLADALRLARACRQFDIAELLGGHGAQPKQATFRTSCEKLDLFMMEHLLRSGADPNRDNVFADVLNSIKARPLLRFYRQFHTEFPALEDQAALALAEAVKNRQVRWTALLAWARKMAVYRLRPCLPRGSLPAFSDPAGRFVRSPPQLLQPLREAHTPMCRSGLVLGQAGFQLVTRTEAVLEPRRLRAFGDTSNPRSAGGC